MDQEQILQEFVDAATKGVERFSDPDAYVIFFDRDCTQLIKPRRPEFLKDRVAEILPTRDEWTTRSLCDCLKITHSFAEACSLALIVKELGWQSRQIGRENRVHFRKSFANYAAKPGAAPFSPELLRRLKKIAETRDSWTTNSLCEAMNLPVTRKNQQRIGVSIRTLGWNGKQSGGAKERQMRYFRAANAASISRKANNS